MAVVGFDIGTYSSYIGVARAGGIETVANEYSDRCTPSWISLNENSRSIGASAKQQSITNYRNTVAGFSKIVGRSLKDPLVQKELAKFFFPNELGQDKDGNAVFLLQYLGDKQAFTAAQLVGMLLTKLKLTAEAGLKAKVVDAVVSVPVYFTDAERRALLDATQLAGINCLRLMNDTTAAALGYGITKQDLPAENEKPRIVVFADFGYSALQVSACAFNKGKLKVLAVAYDTEVGGREFDEILAKHFAAEFREKYKIDPESKPKPWIRLLQECEKLKKLMSANTQAIPISIECFMEDKDVSSKLSRDQFEKLSEHLLKRVEVTVSSVLESAKLRPGDVHSVEVVGGASRIPVFKRIVSDIFSKEPSTTLNADEAVARGCALQCAILSPAFRVRDFSITECQLYPITLSWVPQTQMDEDNCLEVFNQFHPIPSAKMLTFYRKEPFTLSASYSQPGNIPFPSSAIGTFKINNVAPQPNGDSSKVKVKVKVNSHGLFGVVSATMYEKLEGEESGKEESMDIEDKESPSVNGTAEEAAMQTDPPANAGSAAENNGQEQQSASVPNETEENKQDVDEKGENKKSGGKKVNKIKTIDLPIEAAVPQLSKDLLNRLIEIEGQMIMQDRLEKERADAKNSVEEYVYEMRDKIFSVYDKFIKDDDRDRFSLKLEDTENWLYEDGELQHKQAYIDKLSELKIIGQPVQDRFREAEEWPYARDEFGAAVIHVRKFLDLWHAGDEKYNHLDKTDVDKVQKCLEEKMNWWGPKLEAQSRIQPHEDPVLFCSQVRAEKKALESICNPIINKPKPKVEPPKEEKKAEDKSAQNAAGDGTDSQTPSSDPGAAASQDTKAASQMDVD